MTAASRPFERAIGIDVSASRRAGALTWLTTIVQGSHGPEVSDVQPAGQLLQCPNPPEAVFPALVDWIGRRGHVVIGVDSPFGLPRQLVAASSWPDFVAGFPTRFPDPEAFRDACRAAAGGRELRRDCDREAKTPFAAYNLRLYRQTWWVIAGLLHPLVLSGRAMAVPMQPPEQSLPVLLEACPASSLKRRGVYGSYKGTSGGHHAARRRIVAAMIDDGLRIPAPLRTAVVDDPGGDALDAVVAGWATWRAAQTDGAFEARNEADRLEARVYF